MSSNRKRLECLLAKTKYQKCLLRCAISFAGSAIPGKVYPLTLGEVLILSGMGPLSGELPSQWSHHLQADQGTQVS